MPPYLYYLSTLHTHYTMTRDNAIAAGGGRDRGGGNYRGTHKSGNPSSGKQSPSAQKFTLQAERRMQATFSNILEQIANYIQLTFEDGQIVADSIANLVIEENQLRLRTICEETAQMKQTTAGSPERLIGDFQWDRLDRIVETEKGRMQ